MGIAQLHKKVMIQFWYVLNSFESADVSFLYPVGKGGLGKVWKVQQEVQTR
jgi:hypothetical protein